MRFGRSFSFVFATLLFILFQVEATPSQLPPRTRSLSLKRLPQRSDLPPSVVSATVHDMLFERDVVIDYTPISFCNNVSIVATADMRG